MEIIEKLKALIVEAETDVQEKDVIDSSDSSDNDDAEAGTDLSDVYAKIDEIIASVSDLEGRISAVEENLKQTVEVPIEEKTYNDEVEENKFSRIAKLINKN